MPLLTGSIEANVPVSFADREWREYVGRAVYDRFPEGYEDVRSSFADFDAAAGKVIFADLGPNWSRVSVELEYTPHSDVDPQSDVVRAQQELDRDLGKYRDFVLRRCDEELCRN